tara:strand:- start:171 stop:1130 length:960 start_codon:yes stop_codon:yes gene_type:complete
MAIKVNENNVIITKGGKISCRCCEPLLPTSGFASIFRNKRTDPCSFFLDGQSEGDYDFHTTRFQQRQFFRERYGPNSFVNKCFGCWQPSSELEGCCVFDTRTETKNPKENPTPFVQCEGTNTTVVTGDCVPCINASATTPYWSSEIEGSNEVTAEDELNAANFGDWTSRSITMHLSPQQSFYRKNPITTFENFYYQDSRIYQQDAYVVLKIRYLVPSKLYEWKIKIQEYTGGGTSSGDPWEPNGEIQYSTGSFETDELGEIIDPDGFYDGRTDFNWSYSPPQPDDEDYGDVWTQLPMVIGRVYGYDNSESGYTVSNAPA